MNPGILLGVGALAVVMLSKKSGAAPFQAIPTRTTGTSSANVATAEEYAATVDNDDAEQGAAMSGASFQAESESGYAQVVREHGLSDERPDLSGTLLDGDSTTDEIYSTDERIEE